MAKPSADRQQQSVDLVSKVRETVVPKNQADAMVRERTMQALSNTNDRKKIVEQLLADPTVKSQYPDAKSLDRALEVQATALRQQATLDKKMEAEKDKPGLLRRGLNTLWKGTKAVLTSKWTWLIAAAAAAYLTYTYWPGIPAIQAWMQRLVGVEAGAAISGAVGSTPAAAAPLAPELLNPAAPITGEMLGGVPEAVIPPLSGGEIIPEIPH
jgi:hypothetical protein